MSCLSLVFTTLQVPSEQGTPPLLPCGIFVVALNRGNHTLIIFLPHHPRSWDYRCGTTRARLQSHCLQLKELMAGAVVIHSCCQRPPRPSVCPSSNTYKTDTLHTEHFCRSQKKLGNPSIPSVSRVTRMGSRTGIIHPIL